MNVSSRLKPPLMAGRDFPEIQGKVRLVLHNCKNHTDDFVYESHNTATNALADIFAANYGGLVNYNNFADLYKTWLGGVLVFKNALDPTAVNDYGIPDRITNPITAHAGQTPLTSQADDTTRGNPDDAGTVITANTTKLVWEWGTSAGNGQISAVGLTHTDVGSYGAGVASTAQASLDPFADVGAISKSYTYGDNANAPMAINGNDAYTFYMVDATTVDIYKAPINSIKFNLQGGSLAPLSAYATKTVATVASCSFTRRGEVYYHFDFTANTLTLWRVPTEGGTTLLQDVISLADGTVTSTSITVTGASLWKFHIYGGNLDTPCKAIVNGGYLYVYGYSNNATKPDKMYRIEISTPGNIAEVDTSDFSQFYYPSDTWNGIQNERITTHGGLIIHDNFLINGNKTFGLNQKYLQYNYNKAFGNYGGISSPVFGINNSQNTVSVCKMFLGTKFLLDNPVTKSSAQSMTISYELTQS